MGDPLWLTVINNNTQWGIVHLVAVERPLLFRGSLCSLQGHESYRTLRGTNKTNSGQARKKMEKFIAINFFWVIIVGVGVDL